MGREYVFSAHILSLSTGPLSNPAGLAFDHLLRCFCFNRSTFFFPKVNEKLIDIIIGFFESALCTSFVALPSILNCNKKNGPNPHPASLRSSNDPERSPSLIKRISRRTWHTPIPDGLCERTSWGLCCVPGTIVLRTYRFVGIPPLAGSTQEAVAASLTTGCLPLDSSCASLLPKLLGTSGDFRLLPPVMPETHGDSL